MKILFNSLFLFFWVIPLHSFESDDGQKREEHGELRHVGTDQEGIAVHGSYSYILNGVTYTVNYVADENGFRPEGIHIPQGA